GIDISTDENHQENIEAIRAQILPKKEESKRILMYRRLSAAAGMVFLLGLGVQLWDSVFPNQDVAHMDTAGEVLEQEIRKKETQKDLNVVDSIDSNRDKNELNTLVNNNSRENIAVNFSKPKNNESYPYTPTTTESPKEEIEFTDLNLKNNSISSTDDKSVSKPGSENKPAPNDDTFEATSQADMLEEEVAEEEPPAATKERTQAPSNNQGYASLKKQNRTKQETSKDESKDDAYYSDSGVLVETDFEINDSTYTYKGNVFDEFGEPLIGANIVVKGTDVGTTSDYNGEFVLTSPKLKPTLEVFSIGYEPSSIRPIRTEDKLSIYLATSDVVLSEVTIAGYKSKAKKESLAKYTPKDGYLKWAKYLRKNLKYSKAARKAKIAGNVKLGFDIHPDGSKSNIKVLQSLGYGCDEEAIRLLQEGPAWLIQSNEVTPAEVSITFDKYADVSN
ncbi:MAG: TonB family protein, partial [Bacteroidota bacterium]